MAGSGKKSLTPFYVVFGIILVGGGLFIASKGMQKGPPPLEMNSVVPVGGPRGITLGPDSAPVEVVEFSDFQCPFCAQFVTLQMPDVKQRLLGSGNVRWRFVHFPLFEIHPDVGHAHLAAACANEQGRFWEMHDIIYQYQGDWSTRRNPAGDMRNYARQAGVDMGRYDSCVNERRAWGQVLADKAWGDSLRVGGTPTFFVNGRQVEGATVDRLVALRDSIIAAPAARRTSSN